jgi:hypothetical protein
MADEAQVAEGVADRYEALRPHLDERQRRLLLGAEARQPKSASTSQPGSQSSQSTPRRRNTRRRPLAAAYPQR